MGLWRRLADRLRGRTPRSELPPDIQALLAGYQGPEPERVRRAIVSLAGEDHHLVRHWLESARIDYRDVLQCEEQARTGVPAPTVEVERLRSWLAAGAVEAPAPHPAGSSSVVLVRTGEAEAEVLKAVRAASGLGLADVAALVAQAPVAILTGVTEEEATTVGIRLRALGATVELH